MDMTREEIRDVVRENIRRRRAELGLSQIEAAARANIAQPSWARFESGAASPRLEVLADIAVALQTQPDALLSPQVFSAISG